MLVTKQEICILFLRSIVLIYKVVDIMALGEGKGVHLRLLREKGALIVRKGVFSQYNPINRQIINR